MRINFKYALVSTLCGWFTYKIMSDKSIVITSICGVVFTSDIIEAHQKIKERIV